MRPFCLLVVLALRAGAQELPSYPGAKLIPIGMTGRPAGGAMAYFTTPDSLADVARSFLARWASAGIPTTLVGDGREELAVSAFFTGRRQQTMVVLRVLTGSTLGLVWSRSWATDVGPLAGASPEGLIAPAASASSRILTGTVGEVAARLGDELRANGDAVLRERRLPKGGILLEATRSGRPARFLVLPLDRERTVLVSWGPMSAALEDGP